MTHFLDTDEGITLVEENGYLRPATDVEKELRVAITEAHRQLSHYEDKGPKQIGRALMTLEKTGVIGSLCERCHTRLATMLLGKGLKICSLCYQSPEDVIKDL